MGLLSLLASRRHIVPYANPEAVASCSLVRRARRRAALILFSLGAIACIVTKGAISDAMRGDCCEVGAST